MSEARLARIGAALDEVRASCDTAARVSRDPVSFVHRFEALEDREIVAVLASSLAFGNVKALTQKIDEALGRLGPSPAVAFDDPAQVRRALSGWKHRLYTAEDVTCLGVGARAIQREAGTLGAFIRARFDEADGDLATAMDRFVDEVRRRGGLDRRKTAGAKHILARPGDGSASKRLMLLMRWMARPKDGVDLGLWDVPTSALVIPLDVHLHRLSKNLGLTSKNNASWAAATEVTRELRRIDPDDPVKYDFALCHLGMLQGCPSKRDVKQCEGCGVKPVCVHWSRKR